MVQRGLSISWVVLGALLELACDRDGNDRKAGVDGLEEASEQYTDYWCTCDEQQGIAEVGAYCHEEDTSNLDAFPSDCFEAVFARHPEARAHFDCAARVSYDYVDCLVAQGCPEPFACADGSTIDLRWVCDGFAECPGGEDESDCAEDAFPCADGLSIPRGLRCDGEPDCAGGEDEPADCPPICEVLYEEAFTRDCGELSEEAGAEVDACLPFYCDTGAAVRSDVVCDGKPDCPEGEDEWDC